MVVDSSLQAFDTDVKSKSKRTSNRDRNRCQIQIKTDVKWSSKPTSNRARKGRPFKRSTLHFFSMLAAVAAAARAPPPERPLKAANPPKPNCQGPTAAAAAAKIVQYTVYQFITEKIITTYTMGFYLPMPIRYTIWDIFVIWTFRGCFGRLENISFGEDHWVA